MASGPDRRPRKLDGWEAIGRWCGSHPVEDWAIVERALMAVQDGTWADTYQHLDELTRKHAVILVVAADLWIVWRPIIEYPDHFRVLFVGHPDDYDFGPGWSS